MALPNELIVNNTTGNPVQISDLGLPVLPNGTITLTDYATVQEIKSSASLYALIVAGTLLIRVGGVNLSVAESKRFFIEPIETGSRTTVVVAADTNQATNGTMTIDDIPVVAGDRVLLTAQTTTNENGVWIVQAGNWVRPYDFNTGDAVSGASVVVKRGTVNGDAIWVCSSDPGVDIVGTNPLFFSKQEGASGSDPLATSQMRYIVYSRGSSVIEAEHFALENVTLV